MTDNRLVEAIAVRQGLARAPLFRAGEVERPDVHDVWLDGRYGSFLLSTSGRDEMEQAASWAWSSGIPHHIGVVGDDVRVLRWDAPQEAESFSRRDVLDNPDLFYERLRADRVVSQSTIVAHCLNTFRQVRALVHHRGIEDTRSLDAYLALLARLCSSQPTTTVFPVVAEFDLPEGASSLLRELPGPETEAIARQFFSLEGSPAHAMPRLAVRHASGDVFQEAHFALTSARGPDLFAETPPAAGRKQARGSVHFTPPFLARSLAEEAISRLGDLVGRPSLDVMDIACGSGAFLVECLRALERKSYAGTVRVVGRDISLTAVHMARFVIGIAVNEWPGPGRASVDICVGDALRDRLPEADLVVVNPPFVRGQELGPETREVLRGLLSLPGGHLDLSMGFVSVASRMVRSGGAVAALMPAKLLESEGSKAWRRAVNDGMQLALMATFSDVKIFEHATVRIGALVMARGSAEGPVVELRTTGGTGSTEDALRVLRARGLGSDGIAEGANWTLRVLERPAAAVRAAFVDRLPDEPVACAVTDLFDVRMGMRTGRNAAFVRSASEFSHIPAAERRFYREAVTADGISDGRVKSVVYVFYPHGDQGPVFEDEDGLKASVPVTFSRFLEPWRKVLSRRRGQSGRWWEMSFHAPGLLRTPPAIISKYFALPGGFTVDATRRRTVLQGFGWVPRDELAEALAPDDEGAGEEMAIAYLAVLNSAAFFRQVGLVSPAIGGGQYDMSARHLRSVPLMSLARYPEIVPDLAGYARTRYLGRGVGLRGMTEREVEDWVAEKLAQARSGRVFPAVRGAVGPDNLPGWATWLACGAQVDATPERYVDIVEHLQNMSMREDVAEVDAVLQFLDERQMSERSMITLVRTTFGFRSRLPHWPSFRDRAERALDFRGRPARKILLGLYR